MNCELARAQLMALLDGELTEEAREEVEAHSAGCPDCQKGRESLSQTLELADTWEIAPFEEGAQALLDDIEGAGLQELLGEMQALRAEVRQLRAEVATLRGSDRAGSDAWKRPPVLLPAAAQTAPSLHLV